MKHLKNYNLFENNANKYNWIDTDTKEDITGYLDYDYPDEPMFYIKRLTAPRFDGSNDQPENIHAKIDKNPKGIYELTTGSEEQSIFVKTDTKGIIIAYDRAGSDQFDSDGYDRFHHITGTEEEDNTNESDNLSSKASEHELNLITRYYDIIGNGGSHDSAMDEVYFYIGNNKIDKKTANELINYFDNLENNN